MLFFKEIKTLKLADPDFKSLYARECHICSLTLKVIEKLEESAQGKNRILHLLNIRSTDYAALKSGDHCRPEQVKMLCRHLGIETDDYPACSRLKSSKKDKSKELP